MHMYIADAVDIDIDRRAPFAFRRSLYVDIGLNLNP